MKSAPGYLWGGANVYHLGLDRPLPLQNRSPCFKNAVTLLQKNMDDAQIRLGNEQRTRSFNG